ncbi:MOSC domain-containing protein [Affinibrenneria salicis]|nr:MOSC domain-containing protein [Affinibrenneria salicis]
MTEKVTPVRLASLKAILCNTLSYADQSLPPVKQKRSAPAARIHLDGLECDNGDREQYDDPDNALMHYAWEHYAFWRERFPAKADLLAQPGIFGENFSTEGMSEADICIGDVLKVGSARVQVSWGREACHTMEERFDDPEMPQAMHHLAKNGWFYRVLEEGDVRVGDVFMLADRPHPHWTLSRVQQVLFGNEQDVAVLETLQSLPYLAAAWRTQFAARLAALRG